MTESSSGKGNQQHQRVVGILVVGLGGANGTTMVAGVVANRDNIEWRGPQGQEMSPNYYGCITQLNSKGVHGGVGYKDRINGLADANYAAIGGWDIRPDLLGDALLKGQILDYDLVRQVKDTMNQQIPVLRGLYDPRFIGSSQHATATHVLPTKMTDADALEHLRNDIRHFKCENNVDGHTTVIWSASVEPNSEYVVTLNTADELLAAIQQTEEQRGGIPLPPSLLYATAAALEGCSFINGGSQNTLSCPGLTDLATRRQQHQNESPVYCLGTDFKAGQTKFKTAAVEYIRTMGLKPQVVASSNHLGNNDMCNLATSKATSTAKLRVKHNIFEAWHEHDLDHKVSIMYTPFINDEKRDLVEYTSLGFLGQVHTMMTYTRASDSVLCVPLMLDGAIWCDYFASKGLEYEKVAKALAYLFKIPEGAAKGVDPGFFKQMQELEKQALAASDSPTMFFDNANKTVAGSSCITSSPWEIPSKNASIICAGLACLDIQLNHATGSGTGESIESFNGETSIGGGSVAMACKTLARLCHSSQQNSNAAVVESVVALFKAGYDRSGDELITRIEDCGSACHNVNTTSSKAARAKDPKARTAMSVLPIYDDGRRGCFFDNASNKTFSPSDLIGMIKSLPRQKTYGAFIFGYPHLLPKLQGESLAQVFQEARISMADGGITALDLNGVPEVTFETKDDGLRSQSSLQSDQVIGAALEHVDIIHMNEEELMRLTGSNDHDKNNGIMERAANLFLWCGVGIVVVTRGSKGSYVACNDAVRFQKSPALPSEWAGQTIYSPCIKLPDGTIINSNGAGDAYTSGFLVGAMLRRTSTDDASKETSLDLKSAARFASLVASSHINVSTRNHTRIDADDLVSRANS